MAMPGPRSTRLHSPRRRTLRAALLWVGFGAVALATAVAVFRLYETVRRELQEQGEAALRQQQAKLLERARAESEAARRATMKSLIAFHSEGLAHALRQWDENDPAIVGTFEWRDAGGFLPGATFPPALGSPDRLVELWRQFRGWRGQHPDARAADTTSIGEWRSTVVPTLDSATFTPAELGYQAENLDMLRYAGSAVDPWSGWAGNTRDTRVPWVFWYQAGPGAPIRGCFYDAQSIVARLRAEFADRQLAVLDVVPAGAAAPAGPTSLVGAVPGFAVQAGLGDLYAGKQAEARFAVLAVVLLLGVFAVGGGLLALASRREIRDAERKATFVAQVSHELRTPLTSIRMFADLLADPALPESKRSRFAATISRESERLRALIERLLMFNALEHERRAAAIVAVDVAAIACETLDETEAMLARAGLHVARSLPDTPVVTRTDPSAVKQALLNLLDNAQKYAAGSGILRVSLAQAPREIRLRVADEGPGIPRALGERVFEPFVQGGRTLTDKSPGIGLGLSIARGMLRQAGGDLVLLPSEKGAIFEIRLPLSPDP
jgi:signal transduction histidine kinase